MKQTSENGEQRVVPKKLAHAVVRTAFERLPAVANWYREVLMARTVFSNPAVEFMTYDDEHHRLAVLGVPGLGERPLNVAGVDHIAFTFGSLGDLIYTDERLKAQGIEPATPIHHGVTISLYYLDPDRNQVELQIDAMEDPDEIEAFMTSDYFAKNPIGVVFDPDELAQRFHAGVAEEELKKPIQGPLPPPNAFAEH